MGSTIGKAGPKKEGDEKTRLKEVEHEIFKRTKMVERGVKVNHEIITQLIDDHKNETDSYLARRQQNYKLRYMIYTIKTVRNKWVDKKDKLVTLYEIKTRQQRCKITESW